MASGNFIRSDISSAYNLYKINSNIWGILELNNKNKNTDTNINNYTNNNIFYDSYGRLSMVCYLRKNMIKCK